MCVNFRESKKGGGVEENKESIDETLPIERKLYQFPKIVERSAKEHSPHYLCTYLHELSREFNSFYGRVHIVKKGDSGSGYKVFVTNATRNVVRNGLHLLGMSAPDNM